MPRESASVRMPARKSENDGRGAGDARLERTTRNVLDRFVGALRSQDKGALLQLLSADVTWTSDGGGKAKAAKKVIHGAEHVALFALAGSDPYAVVFAWMGTFSSLGILILLGLGKLWSLPTDTAPAHLPGLDRAPDWWLFLTAFASGCAALMARKKEKEAKQR